MINSVYIFGFLLILFCLLALPISERAQKSPIIPMVVFIFPFSSVKFALYILRLFLAAYIEVICLLDELISLHYEMQLCPL